LTLSHVSVVVVVVVVVAAATGNDDDNEGGEREHHVAHKQIGQLVVVQNYGNIIFSKYDRRREAPFLHSPLPAPYT